MLIGFDDFFFVLQVWLTLADQYLHSISIDWEKTLRFAFNDRSNPDDDSLGIQIVKVEVLACHIRNDRSTPAVI